MYLLVTSGMQMHPIGNCICSPFGDGYDMVSVYRFSIEQGVTTYWAFPVLLLSNLVKQ
jgi:hypothetical protein